MNRKPSSTAIAAAIALLALAPTASTQDEPDNKQLAEWPALKKTERDRVRMLIKQFRKDDEKLHASAHTRLKKLGAGTAPLLMRQVSDKAKNINEPLFAVLDELLIDQHGALLARQTSAASVELRRYVTRKLCLFHSPELVPVFVKAAADKDEHVAFYASLGMLAQKKEAGVDVVLAAARKRWAEVGPLIGQVLPAARSDQCASWIFAKINKAPPAEQMAGLRLLRYLMVKQQNVILRSYLEAPDHTVKRAAINTARVLHGEDPIENLSVFKAIEMAKEWLTKL